MPKKRIFFRDFRFFLQSFAASPPRKVLYFIAILSAGITVVACVVLGMQQSPRKG